MAGLQFFLSIHLYFFLLLRPLFQLKGIILEPLSSYNVLKPNVYRYPFSWTRAIIIIIIYMIIIALQVLASCIPCPLLPTGSLSVHIPRAPCDARN